MQKSQNKYPKISIVVPSYNQGEYLEDTLKSILTQNYNNIELIVIDGGSNDNTLEVIKKYEASIDYWISERDSGQTDALIKGFERATGEVYFWLCSDDQIEPGVLKEVAECFASDSKLDLVYGDTEYLYPDGTKVLKPRIGYNYEIMLRAFNIIAQPSAFFTSRVYKSVNGLDVSLNYAMDYDLFLRFGPKVKWKQMKYSISLYRIQPNSKTVNDVKKFENEWWLVREKINKRKRNFVDTLLWYFYTFIVVLKFWTERRVLKLKYDQKKYISTN